MKNQTGEMPFLDHLEELRWRILWSVVAVFVCTVIGIIAVMRLGVMDLLLAPLYGALADVAASDPSFQTGLVEGRLAFLNLTEPFFFVMKLGFISGLVLASPVVVYQMWAFLSPALQPREKRMIVPSLLFGLLLFAAGVSLAYFAALPATIRFLLAFGSEWFTPTLTGGYYLELVTRLLLAFGLVFELPVVVTILASLGIVSPAFLRAKRRHAVVLIAILASFLSPGDYVSVMAMLMAPLILLYEVSILLAGLVHRRRGDESGDHPADPAAVPMLFVLGMVTERWRNRLARTVATEGV